MISIRKKETLISHSIMISLLAWFPVFFIYLLIIKIKDNQYVGDGSFTFYTILLALVLVPVGIFIQHITTSRKLMIKKINCYPFHENQDGSVIIEIHNNGANLIEEAHLYCMGEGPKIRASEMGHKATGSINPRGITSVNIEIPKGTLKRGAHQISNATLVTTFPFAMFSTYIRKITNKRIVVYPSIEMNAPDWPKSSISPKKSRFGEDIMGSRDYRSGDSIKNIDWKLSARRSQTVVREFEDQQPDVIAFSLKQVENMDLEAGLSRLTAWIVRAEKERKPYGLTLEHNISGGGLGGKHQAACLEALALFKANSHEK